MISLKRFIASLIVCLKPHVFLTLCIILVIAQSIFLLIRRGITQNPEIERFKDLTWTLTAIVIVAFGWVAFFAFIMRFELINELDTLLILFQCSKRGLRFLGVVAFHLALLSLIAFVVSSAVERSILPTNMRNQSIGQQDSHDRVYPSVTDYRLQLEYKGKDMWSVKEDARQAYRIKRNSSDFDRGLLMVVYKIWLTAIVYAFSYLIIENIVMFYTDLTLVEWVHIAFLDLVAKTTGIDLSDYPAGEMLFNPLIRRRIR